CYRARGGTATMRSRAGIAPRTRSKSCSCRFCPGPVSPSSTRRAGSCSSTGKGPAPASRRAEEDNSMRLRIGIIGIVALASLAGCGGYTGTYGGGGGGWGGRGRGPGGLRDARPRNQVREPPQWEHERGRGYDPGGEHRHVDVEWLSATQRPIHRLPELFEQPHHESQRGGRGD